LAVTSLHDIAPAQQVLENAPRGLPLPWWAKIGAKIVLSRVFPSYRTRKALGLFLHGNLDQNVAQHHAFVKNVLAQHERVTGSKAATLLELGPGNSLGTALFAAAEGVERMWLADVGDFASNDMAFYRRLAGMVPAYPGHQSINFTDRAGMLASINATYLTGGTASLAELPDGSLDLILSTAVLEHVGRADFSLLAREMLRLLRPGGTAYHEVDLMDHLGGAQNNLRFSEQTWEGPLMAKSGFYTNRLRCREILQIMRDAGFEAALTRVTRWGAPPTPRAALAAPFRALPDDELLIANFGMLLRKPL
jgi:SAM-dependent methyltransferase